MHFSNPAGVGRILASIERRFIVPIIVWHGGDPGSPNAGNAFGTAALARLEQFRKEDNANKQRKDAYAQANQLNDADNYASMKRTNFAEQGRDRRAQAASTERYTRDNENRASKEHLAATVNDARLELEASKQGGMLNRLSATFGFKGKQDAAKRAANLPLEEAKVAATEAAARLSDARTDEIYNRAAAGKVTTKDAAALFPRESPDFHEAWANAKNARVQLDAPEAGKGGGNKAAAISAEVKSVIQDLENQRDYYRKAAMEEKDPKKRADLKMQADQEQQKINRLLRAQEQAAPAPPPAAAQPPAPGQQPQGDIDPNAIHAAAVRLASENPTWTREQIKAAIQAMMGNR